MHEVAGVGVELFDAFLHLVIESKEIILLAFGELEIFGQKIVFVVADFVDQPLTVEFVRLLSMCGGCE